MSTGREAWRGEERRGGRGSKVVYEMILRLCRVWGQAGEHQEDDTIHIFSLASGHLYERFLKIMMLSVVANTNSHVKFWLLSNFLSPQFKVETGEHRRGEERRGEERRGEERRGEERRGEERKALFNRL
jgi:hypothetical protein